MADFQQHKAEFDALNAEIVALSADREEEAWGTVERMGLTFRVLYGLDPEATSRTIGCYTGTHGGQPHGMRCIRAAKSAGSRRLMR